MNAPMNARPGFDYELIMAAVSGEFGVHVDDLRGPRRLSEIVDARAALTWLLRLPMRRSGRVRSLSEISRIMHRSDKSSAQYWFDRAEGMRRRAPEFRRLTDALARHLHLLPQGDGCPHCGRAA